MVTTGRGYAYPTAREAALKLMETSYLAALSFSGADLLHGPLAMADSGRAGARRRRLRARVVRSMRDVLTRLSASGGPTSSWSGPAPTYPGSALRIPTPDVDERYAPLLDILPLQRLALALASPGARTRTPRAA